MTGEERLARTFVELADTMVNGFDIIEFLHMLTQRTVELLNVDAAGLILADQHDQLHVMAASPEQACLVDLFRMQNEEGPCLECFRTGQAVVSTNLEADRDRWPHLADAALGAGFHALTALPMRLREQVIGAMNLFRTEPDGLSDQTVAIGQALVDVATIGLLYERAVKEHHLVTEQLQTALNSRILIEQAKGMLAAQHRVGMDQAFQMLRRFARDNNRRLAEVAVSLVENKSDVAPLLASAPTPQTPT